MAVTDYKLKYLIEADGTKAKAEVKQVETAFDHLYKSSTGLQGGIKGAASEISNIVSAFTGDRLGGAASQVTSLANAFGAIPGPVGIAVGAVAGLGVASLGTGLALFELTKKAADYGSTIHDASDKTGLHAETLSAMDVAAQQSGTSLDEVTSALSKFTKNVSAGKDELKAFGITPKQAINDLDGSLAKVFKRIADAKPGYEQIVLAQKAFGKSGADLLPFIKQFNGDLPALIAHAKALGLTLSDEDARAADDFGDQLAELQAQARAVGFAFARELMPVFKDAMHDIEGWIGRNKDTIRDWGDYTANILSGVIAYWKDLVHWSSQYMGNASFQSPGGQSYGLGTFLTTGVWGMLAGDRGAEERRKSDGPAWSGRGFRINPETNTLEAVPEGPAKPTGIPDFSSSKSAKDIFKLSPQAKAIVDAAGKIGISPLDLATIIGFETGGTYSTSKTNSVGRFGLIQFGSAEASQYGAVKGQSFEGQLDSVVKYLVDRFKKAGVELAGANLLTLYKSVLAGSPSASGSVKDAYGTSAISGVRQMLLGGTQQGALNRFFGGKESNIPSDKAGRQLGEMTKADRDADAKRFQDYWAFKRDLQKAGVDYLLTQAEREVEMLRDTGASYDVAQQKAKAVADLKIQNYTDEIQALEDLFDSTDDVNKRTEIRRQIELKTIDAQIAAIKINNDQRDSVVELTSKYYDLADALKDAESLTEKFIQESNGGLSPNEHGTGVGDSGDRHARVVQQAIEKHTEALEKIHAKIDSMPAGDVLTRGMKERPGVVADQVHKDIRSDAGKGMKIGSAMGLR
jgi:hypothetical protein